MADEVKEVKEEPVDVGIVYAAGGCIEILDSDTLARRKTALEAAGYSVNSIAVGDVNLVITLAGKNKHAHSVSEIKTPTQAQVDAAAKLAEAQAKQKADSDARALAAKEAKPKVA